jgi:hypothetical protein
MVTVRIQGKSTVMSVDAVRKLINTLEEAVANVEQRDDPVPPTIQDGYLTKSNLDAFLVQFYPLNQARSRSRLLFRLLAIAGISEMVPIEVVCTACERPASKTNLVCPADLRVHTRMTEHMKLGVNSIRDCLDEFCNSKMDGIGEGVINDAKLLAATLPEL